MFSEFGAGFTGLLGETVISLAAWIKLDSDIYFKIDNVTLPLPNGGTTQIDHVIVSKFGIFVIETKNYKGWVFGSTNQAQWRQVLYGGRKFKFQNPLRQNYLHIKTLANLLNLEEKYFHSVIAFIGECEIKTQDELPENVMNQGMMRYIKTKQDVLFSSEQVQSIYQAIKHSRLDDTLQTRMEHKEFIRNKQQSDSNNPKCPSCQSLMVKRVAKTGSNAGKEFWGCSQFPRCRSIFNVY